MACSLINNEISLTYPDSFQLMDGPALREAYLNDDPDRWGIIEEELHLMITVLWQRTNALAVRLSDLPTVALRNEALTRAACADCEYEARGFVSRTLGGRPAEGYCYSYLLNGEERQAYSLLFKQKSRIYGVTCICRQEDSAAWRERFDAILDTLEIK